MLEPRSIPMPPPLRERIAVSDAVLERLARISSGSLSTQLFKRGFRQPVLVGLRPLQGNQQRFAGRAFTMRMIPAREDIDTYATLTDAPNADNLQWVAVEHTQAGDVMVIDSRGDASAASMGNILITRMMKRGARAVVSDGAFRDGEELRQLDFPVWSAGITATTRLSYHHVADLQVPVCCAGVAVYPGDVIHGDADNVSVIPAHLAAELAETCEAQDQIEAYLVQRIARGEALWGLYPPSDATRRQYREWVSAGKPALA
jgi:regulator of RNase E activity RraA